jgi:hypothetical protein
VWGPRDVFLGALRSLLFVREEPRNSNAGQAVEAFLKSCGLGKGHPWCMAFLSHVGRQCFANAWPLPMTAGCQPCYDAAKAKGLTVTTEALQVGDMVVIWNAKLGRFAHVCVIAGPKSAKGWPTIEGNTNDGGSRDGWGVFARHRTFASRDRGIQWWRAIA